MASLIEAIDIKRKMYFEYEGAPYHVLDVEVSRPTARGGQTLVRIKMRNLVTRAVFDKTFKAGEKFGEPDLVMVDAAYLYADSAGLNFMDQESFDTLTLRLELLGDDRLLLTDNLVVQVQKFNGNPIGLYQAELSAAWRNAELPRVNRPNETGFPPLGLNLRYLLTAYGENNSDRVSHLLLGQAMSVLHDHPVLGRPHIRRILPQSRLHEQLERIRISPQPLSLDEMSKLWTTFQTQYRLSAAYEAAVVLIESTRTAHAALPVLTRGREDAGVFVLPTRAPALTAVLPPRSQAAAQLGDDLVITGERLDVAGLAVRLTSTRLPEPILLDPLLGGTASEVRVHLPAVDEDTGALARWTPGFYTANATVRDGDLPENAQLTSNEIAWALAPRIAVSPTDTSAGTVSLRIACIPRLRADHRVLLLLTPAADGGGSERQVAPENVDTPNDPAQPTTIGFRIRNLTAGTYAVRLRVDGVDSLPVEWTGTPPRPRFDPKQMVTIH